MNLIKIIKLMAKSVGVFFLLSMNYAISAETPTGSNTKVIHKFTVRPEGFDFINPARFSDLSPSKIRRPSWIDEEIGSILMVNKDSPLDLTIVLPSSYQQLILKLKTISYFDLSEDKLSFAVQINDQPSKEYALTEVTTLKSVLLAKNFSQLKPGPNKIKISAVISILGIKELEVYYWIPQPDVTDRIMKNRNEWNTMDGKTLYVKENNSWQEITKGVVTNLVEKSYDRESVNLYDSANGRWISLGKNKGQWRKDELSPWRLLSFGFWKR